MGLEVINRKLTPHITQEGTQSFLQHTHNIPKDKTIALLEPVLRTIALLELVLNNCVFSFQHRFDNQLQGTAMGSLVSPVIADIYMEYFEELVLGPLCPIPMPL